MGKFKVGDRVRFTANVIGINLLGKTGTVIPDKDCVILPGEGATVQLDKPLKDFFGEETKDWVWVFDYKLELIDPNKPEKQPVIVITSDGKTTTATKRLGKQVICSATARCSDNDTFDFNTGAELAFQRLREKEKPVPKRYNGKVVCIESGCSWWTVGKIYTVTEGSIKDDEGDIHSGLWKTVSEINDWAPYARRFIPLVED